MKTYYIMAKDTDHRTELFRKPLEFTTDRGEDYAFEAFETLVKGGNKTWEISQKIEFVKRGRKKIYFHLFHDGDDRALAVIRWDDEL